MRACVIGGGPSGLFISKYLRQEGVLVDLFEKSNKLMGNYNYARDRKEINTDFGVEVHLGVGEKSIDDKKCDFYILATGARQKELNIEGKEHLIQAMQVIDEWYKKKGDENGNKFRSKDRKVCILGMGNVALDLVHYLSGRERSITVLSRSKLKEAAFDNHVMRDLLKTKRVEVKACDDFEPVQDRKASRRYEMFQREKKGILARIKSALSGITEVIKRKPNLDLIFEAEATKLEKKENGIEVIYKRKNKLHKDVFDCVISSIGFIPNIPEIKTTKPIYRIGWCEHPRGNIWDAQVEAKSKAKEIIKQMKAKEIVRE
ncbi:hypothetical protein GINT2_000983 [Glugoides intestinalis]